jgi:hypothetical protein
MANMPATYPYSMLGYGYPPAYLQLPAGYSQQQLSGLLAGLGAQNLAGLGGQSWATAAVAANTAAVGSANPLMAAGAQQPGCYSNSKQGYPVIAPMTAAAAAGGSPKLCYPGSVPLTVSTAAATAAPPAAGYDKTRTVSGQVTGTAADPGEGGRQEVNGEGEEYLQELIKERDSIESSSASSLSKSHILRLLNKGKVWQKPPGEKSNFP